MSTLIHYGVATISRLLQITFSFAEYRLFYRALLQKRPMILRSLLIVATPYCSESKDKVIELTYLGEHPIEKLSFGIVDECDESISCHSPPLNISRCTSK